MYIFLKLSINRGFNRKILGMRNFISFLIYIYIFFYIFFYIYIFYFVWLYITYIYTVCSRDTVPFKISLWRVHIVFIDELGLKRIRDGDCADFRICLRKKTHLEKYEFTKMIFWMGQWFLRGIVDVWNIQYLWIFILTFFFF